LDFLGCALAGSREPLSGILLESVARSEDGGAAALIGRREHTTRLAAALVNGAAGHALDFDDTHTVMTGHPPAPGLPAPPPLGAAGTQAAALKSAFGSMAKPLHAGRAAETGLLAALLARGGFTASPAILEAPQGFAATHAGAEPRSEALERWAGRFLVRDTL